MAFSPTPKQELLAEIANAITHGIGAALSIAGLVILIVRAVHEGGAMRIVTFTIYGAILFLFYMASTMFHALYYTRASKTFQIFDHSAIYLLIAGTYTPYCLVVVKGWLGWTIFGVIWLMAILGIIYKSLWLGKYQGWSTILYVVMGWMCMAAMLPLYHGLGPVGFWLLVAGGISFTAGAGLYSIKSIPFGHVIWHLFVMLGTGFMYFSILFYA